MPKPSRNTLISLLFLLLFLGSLAIFVLSTQRPFPDAVAYLNMGKGLIVGKFSSWYYLETFYPETLRMPGYPLFIGITLAAFDSIWFILVVQYACLMLSYYLCIRMISKLIVDEAIRKLTKITFLVIAIFSIQLPYYTGQIAPQSLSSTLLVIYFYIFLVHRHTLLSGIVQGIILAGIFQLTPSLLLFPFIVFITSLLKREIFRAQVASLAIFIISALPFGLWNLSNHGVFKITPLEGGAGVAHMGYWQYKLPKNYSEAFYWGNNSGDDLIYPFRISNQEAELNRIRFEEEWNEILTSISHLKTEEDLLWENKMNSQNPGQFILYNSAYTQAREKALWFKTIENALDDPLYYAKTRIYSFFRSYVTGVSEDAFNNSKGFFQHFNILYPFIVTISVILFGIFFISLHIVKGWREINFEIKIIFFAVIYFGVIHTPFATQARYTVPIHMLVFLLLSIFLTPHVKKLVSSK